MVKRSIEYEIRNENFGARNGNFEKNAVVKNQGTKQRGHRTLRDCWQWETNGQCVKGDNCSFRHDINKRGKVIPSNPSPKSFMQHDERKASKTRIPSWRSPSGRTFRWPCKDYFKGSCNKSFCENGTLQNACSTRPRVVVGLVKSAHTHIVRWHVAGTHGDVLNAHTEAFLNPHTEVFSVTHHNTHRHTHRHTPHTPPHARHREEKTEEKMTRQDRAERREETRPKTRDRRHKTEDTRPKRRGQKTEEDRREEDGRRKRTEDRKEKTRGERREDESRRKRQEKRSEDQEIKRRWSWIVLLIVLRRGIKLTIQRLSCHFSKKKSII